MSDDLMKPPPAEPKLTLANKAEDARLAPVVSPTGMPVIPPRFVPWLLLLGGVCAILVGIPVTIAQVAPAIVIPAWLIKVAVGAGVVESFIVLLLGGSPGWRRQPPP